MGSRVMFAVIQENRLLGTGETPLEAWISAYEALGRPLGPEDASAFCLSCTERLARQVRLYGLGVAWQEDRHGRIDAAQVENTVNIPF